MINVSEILPLRPIKVNNGKFYLLLRSGYFVNGCVFTRVYVICKICEKTAENTQLDSIFARFIAISTTVNTRI